MQEELCPQVEAFNSSKATYTFRENEAGCYFVPAEEPLLQKQGQFTFSVWIKQEKSNAG